MTNPGKSGGINPGPWGVFALLGIVAVGGYFAFSDTTGALFKIGTGAATPPANSIAIYAKSGGMYQKNSSGTETSLGGGTQGGTTGATANAIVKASSSNTLADTALFEPASGVLSFGGVAASDAALRDTGTELQVVTATQSAYYPLRASIFYSNGDISAAGRVYNAGEYITIYNTATGQFTWYISGSDDTGLGRATAGVVKVTDGSTGAGWLQDSAGRDYATADQTVDSTTLTADDTISLTLKAGRKYKFTLVYFFTPGDTVADGLKFDMNGGTATMTGFEARVRVVDNVGQDVSVTNSRMTALNTAVSLTGNQPATSFTLYVDGFAEVNAAGTLIPEFAKSADAGTGVVKKKYSQIEALDYP